MSMMVENVLTRALAEGLFLQLDTANGPLTGDLEIYKVAPTLTFTDLGGATADDDWSMGTLGNDLTLTNLDSNTTGQLVLDHIINTRPSPRMPVPNFVGEFSIQNSPTVGPLVGAVQGYFWLQDSATITLGGAYNSYGLISAVGNCTSTGTSNLDAIYLFVNNMTNTATLGQNPAVIHSFDSKPRTTASVVTGGCGEVAALNDWANFEAVGTGQVSCDRWVTVRATAFDPFYYRIISDAAGSSVVITDRIGFEMGDVTKAGGSGTEQITNQYGIYLYPFNNVTTLACGIWIGGCSGAANNYGIVLDSDDVNGGAIWFGAGQNSKIGYDGTDLLMTAGNVRTTAALEIDGDLNHDGTNVGFYGTAPAAQSAAYTPTNVSADRAYDANATTVNELADVLGTLIADLQAIGLIG